MTESEWLNSKEPLKMLQFFWGKWSDRKYRLYTCACCRRVWNLLLDERSRAAIECAELFAHDKYAGYKELEAADDGASEARMAFTGFARDAADAAQCATNYCEDEDADAAIAATKLTARAASGGRLIIQDDEFAAQSGLLKCIFGNPYRLISIESVLLTPTLTSLATVAYQDRALPSGELDTARLSVLAEALEVAGCSNTDILTHLRSPGPHFRGCHVLDLLLGKE